MIGTAELKRTCGENSWKNLFVPKDRNKSDTSFFGKQQSDWRTAVNVMTLGFSDVILAPADGTSTMREKFLNDFSWERPAWKLQCLGRVVFGEWKRRFDKCRA